MAVVVAIGPKVNPGRVQVVDRVRKAKAVEVVPVAVVADSVVAVESRGNVSRLS